MSDAEDKVTKQINQYAELGKENKNINTAALMINALEQAQREEMAASKKKKAYTVSLLLPPVGYLYAIYYWFSDKPDGKHVAKLCVLLTSISVGVTLLLTVWMGNLVQGNLPDQKTNIQDLPNQYRDLLQ